MRCYLDSSAILKRVVVEDNSDHFVAWLDDRHRAGDVVVSSSLAWIEVARALRSRANTEFPSVASTVDDALSGINEYPMIAEVVAVARRVMPSVLRSLDAIHLASALLLEADVVAAYDERLIAACEENGLSVVAPGLP